jgi:hypothetical protein
VYVSCVSSPVRPRPQLVAVDDERGVVVVALAGDQAVRVRVARVRILPSSDADHVPISTFSGTLSGDSDTAVGASTSVTVTTSACSTLSPPLSVLRTRIWYVFSSRVQFGRCPQLVAIDDERRRCRRRRRPETRLYVCVSPVSGSSVVKTPTTVPTWTFLRDAVRRQRHVRGRR